MKVSLVFWALAFLQPNLALAETSCNGPQFSWLGPNKITTIAPIFEVCVKPGVEGYSIATRKFKKAGIEFRLLVDPQKLTTEIEPEACLSCSRTDVASVPPNRFLSALERANHTGTSQGIILNSGVLHAEKAVPGYFLTVDLCPSHLTGLEESIFLALESQELKTQQPVPVAISISGNWMLHHEAALEWLLEKERKGEIQITWINHTLTHPFSPDLPLAHNFLLEPGVKLNREILGLEKLLLEKGLIPSIYFRFPGLVSKADLLDKLKTLFLIPIGSDAWLAKREHPTPGSIILIHGNKNEPVGVHDFLSWLKENAVKSKFFNLSDLFVNLGEEPVSRSENQQR